MDGRLFGRDAELSTVDAFLTEARSGSSALVLEGEPGIGKTTLWKEAGQRAEAGGFTVLTCRPTEAEAKLPFAALTDLLEPVAETTFEGLPGLQRRALEAALLQADTNVVVDPRAVAAGVRGALADLAEVSPVLVAIDDVQWLDRPSAAALGFALRRLSADPVSVLAAQRPATRTRQRLDLGEVRRLELGCLSVAAIHQFLKQRLGRSFPRPLLLRLYETSGGNPFFALEIGRELLHAGVQPGGPLPVPNDLRRLVRRRLSRLSAAAREALLVAAAVAEPTRTLVAAALESDLSESLEEAEQAEVVELEGGSIRFTHPLYATATYAGAPSERRRRVHGRLAAVVSNPEERARHLALATEAPSMELAARLDEAAALAQRRGAPGAAAELTELALARTPPGDPRRQDRILDLIDRLLLSADSGRAARVARAEMPTLIGARRRVHVLLALSELAMWSSPEAWASREEHPVSLAERALAEAGRDASLAARAHTVLAATLESDSVAAVDHARQALALVERGADVPPSVHAEALSVFVRCKLFLGQGLDVPRLRQAIDLERAAPPRLVGDRSSCKLGQWLKYADDFEGSRHWLERARQEASDGGDDHSLVTILINLVILACWAGRWSDARTLGEELVQRFVELGWETSPTPHIALVASLVGDAETVRLLEEMTPWEGVYDVIRLRPLGLLALSQGDASRSYLYYRRGLELLDAAGMREPAVFRIHGDAVESAVQVGELDAAIRTTEELSEHAGSSSIPWNRMIAARSRALIAALRGDLEQALQETEAALREHEALPMPFELGRTLLVKGQIERRVKRKAAAKDSLSRALAVFEELGAVVWAAKARSELSRIGLRPPARDELTETERRVAELAASGLKNREVASKLFLSPKTVDANLARVYRKLGIHSRAELGAKLGSPD